MSMLNLQTPDLIQVRAWSSDAEQAAVNTWYYNILGVPTGGVVTIFDFATAFDVVIETLYKSLLANTATYDGIQCVVINEVPLPRSVANVTSAGIGTGGAIGMARQTAGLLSWETLFAGPGKRGRTFFPFPSTSDDVGLGLPSNGYQVKMGTLANDMLFFENFTGASGGLALCELVLKSKPGFTTTPIEGFFPRPRWATQKKRGSFGRVNVSPI